MVSAPPLTPAVSVGIGVDGGGDVVEGGDARRDGDGGATRWRRWQSGRSPRTSRVPGVEGEPGGGPERRPRAELTALTEVRDPYSTRPVPLACTRFTSLMTERARVSNDAVACLTESVGEFRIASITESPPPVGVTGTAPAVRSTVSAVELTRWWSREVRTPSTRSTPDP